ncbi:hypothetical protein D3C74_326720 [compost metagenome]
MQRKRVREHAGLRVTPRRRNRQTRIPLDMVNVIAQIEELAMDRRDMVEIVVRRAVLSVPYNIVFVLRIRRVG